MFLQIPDILLLVTAVVNILLTWFIHRRHSNHASTVFSLFVAFVAFWAMIIFLFRQTDSYEFSLYLMKLSYISALLLAYFYYRFSTVFPSVQPLPTWHARLITAIAGLEILYFLIPGVLTLDIVRHEWGKEVILEPYAYALFVTSFVFFFLGATLRLFSKIRSSQGVERMQLWVISLTVMIAGIFGMYFNLLLPSPMFQNFKYIWSGPVFTFFFAIVITYSIFRFRLFNPRAILAEALVYLLVVFLFVRLILARDITDLSINGTLLVLVTLIGAVLIRSVTKEVEQRELIEKQEKDLEDVNRQQESLLHFVSHEVKGYLTKSEAAFAAIYTGDYGKVEPRLHDMSGMALADVRKGVDTVIDILDASNLKRGTVAFAKDTFNIVDAVEEIVHDLEPTAKERGLDLVFERPVTGAYTIVGDKDKIRRHVIRNLIDNSIRYTLKGSVRIELSRNDSLIRMVVTDTGVGITPDDMKNLFTEGGKGAESLKVNVHSTGYGLFIAKTIVVGHGGRIWAESDGKDKGSRFIMELPTQSAK